MADPTPTERAEKLVTVAVAPGVRVACVPPLFEVIEAIQEAEAVARARAFEEAAAINRKEATRLQKLSQEQQKEGNERHGKTWARASALLFAARLIDECAIIAKEPPAG